MLIQTFWDNSYRKYFIFSFSALSLEKFKARASQTWYTNVSYYFTPLQFQKKKKNRFLNCLPAGNVNSNFGLENIYFFLNFTRLPLQKVRY